MKAIERNVYVTFFRNVYVTSCATFEFGVIHVIFSPGINCQKLLTMQSTTRLRPAIADADVVIAGGETTEPVDI